MQLVHNFIDDNVSSNMNILKLLSDYSKQYPECNKKEVYEIMANYLKKEFVNNKSLEGYSFLNYETIKRLFTHIDSKKEKASIKNGLIDKIKKDDRNIVITFEQDTLLKNNTIFLVYNIKSLI